MSRLIFRTAVLLVAVAVSSNVAFAHGTSKSYADWLVDGSHAELRVNFAPHDFTVEIPGLDADGDQRVTAAELEKYREQVLARVIGATHLLASRGKGDAIAPCVAESPRLAIAGDPVEEVQVSARFVCPEVIGFLRLETQYLAALDPPHVSVATVSSGTVTAQHIFTPEAPRFELELGPVSGAAVFFDHLARGATIYLAAAMLIALFGASMRYRRIKRAPPA